MELDEAMGVSATFERAPGYTELGQIIPASINQEKGRLIDAPFSKLFEKVVRGDTGLEKEIKDFNKISRQFQKINKVDTPIIEYTPGKKIDASKFIKHFDIFDRSIKDIHNIEIPKGAIYTNMFYDTFHEVIEKAIPKGLHNFGEMNGFYHRNAEAHSAFADYLCDYLSLKNGQ